MDEETDKFINTVRSYSPLWDMRDKRYHSRDIQRKLWVKVAEEMGSDVADLKKKWKGLRDSFRREYKKFLKSGQEAPDEFVSSWPFFELMLFLSDVMEPRELKGNVSPSTKVTSDITNSQDKECMDEDQEHSLDTDLSNNSEIESQPSTASTKTQEMGPPPTTHMKGKRKRLEIDETNKDNERLEKKKTTSKKKNGNSEHVDAQFLEIERAKLQLFSESTSMKGDSEYQFLISLVPHLKKVPEYRQLIVRNKLQQVLIDEQSQSLYASQSPWTSEEQPSYWELQSQQNTQ